MSTAVRVHPLSLCRVYMHTHRVREIIIGIFFPGEIRKRFLCFIYLFGFFFYFSVHIHYKSVPTRDYFTKRAKSFLTTDIKLAKCFCSFSLPDSRCHFASLNSRCPSAGNGTSNCVTYIKVQTPFAWYVL